MIKHENEEYISTEVSEVKEFLYFEAEEYKIPEVIENSFEEYKVKEIEERVIEEGPVTSKKKNFKEQFDKLKTSINSVSTTVSSTVAIVAAVGVGAVLLNPTQPPEILGQVEFINYYVDYYYEELELKQDVRIYFDIDFLEGYYAVVENTSTNEEKNIDFKFIRFEDIKTDVTDFKVSVFNDQEEVVETYDISVNPVGTNNYLGSGDIEYDISINPDGTHNLLLTVDEPSSHLNTYLTDLDDYSLDYDISYTKDTIKIDNIDVEEFNIFVGSYYLENDNYYCEKTYELNAFTIANPSDIGLSKLEVLNSSYATEFGIPTYLYLDGNLAGTDYAEVLCYDSNNNELGRSSNITDLNQPIIFYDLPSEEMLTFKYRTYHKEQMSSEEIYQTDIAIKEEYLYASMNFNSPNPGECLITYNDDGTYNCYVYTGFANDSEFDMIYKLELVSTSDSVSKYEYLGTDKTASFTNVDLESTSYSLMYKVFVCDGINYYAVKDYYLASGVVKVEIDDDGQFLNSHIEITPLEEKTYELYAYSYVEGDAVVEVSLSTGEIINYTFKKEELKNRITLDLTSYEYDWLDIKVTVKCNPYYGLGDLVLESGTVVEGEISKTVTVEYSE